MGKHWTIKDTSKMGNSMRGKKHTEETKRKIRESAISRGQRPNKMWGEDNPQRKGDETKYNSIHQWVARAKGRPKKCQICGKEAGDRRMFWANIDHKYRRNLDDYIPLCGKCHWKYDVEHNGKIFNHFKKPTHTC